MYKVKTDKIVVKSYLCGGIAMLYQEKNSVGINYFECIRYENFEFVPHMHRHPELVNVKAGTLVVQSIDRTEHLEAGQYALILSNQIHAYHSLNHTIVDVCIFSEDHVPYFSQDIKGKRASQFTFTCRPFIVEFANRELFLSDRQPDPYMLRSALYAVLREFRDAVSLQTDEKIDEELIDKMLQYVNNYYTEDITLKSMAEEMGYEPHYLSRYFRSHIKMHFSKFINHYRVDAAIEMLKNTNLSITEIAFKSGFQSIRSFNRAFLDITGKTPRNFRDEK